MHYSNFMWQFIFKMLSEFYDQLTFSYVVVQSNIGTFILQKVIAAYFMAYNCLCKI